MTLPCVLLLLSAAPAAEAKETVEAPPAAHVGFQPRARLGVGYYGGGAGFALIGLSTHAGVQLTDRVAFYGLVQGGISLQSLSFSAGAMAELAPLHWLAFAIGAGMQTREIYLAPLNAAQAISVGVPVRITFTPGSSVVTGGARHRFFFALDGFAGVRPAGLAAGSFDWSAGLSLGYQLM